LSGGDLALEDGALAQGGFAFEALHGPAEGDAFGGWSAGGQLEADVEILTCGGPFAKADGDLMIRAVVADPLDEGTMAEGGQIGLGKAGDEGVVGT
jgi:hypothetical protein